jgi:hypothetical protein
MDPTASKSHDVAEPAEPLDNLIRQALRRAPGNVWEPWLRALLERGERAKRSASPKTTK